MRESGHDHPRRRDRHAARRAADGGDGGAAESGRAAAGAAAARPASGHEHHAGHARRQRRASAVVRRRRDEGDPAGVREEPRAVRAGVLVGRSRSDAARAGRQPESAVARHQRADVEGRRSERRPQPEADSRLPRRESRRARQHECVRHVRPRVFDREPARRRCDRPRDAQLLGDPALHGRRRPTGSERRVSSAGISGDRSRARARPAAVRSGAADVDERGGRRYARVDPSIAQPTAGVRQRPTGGAALIGGTGRIGLPIDAKVIIAQTSIYVPGNDRGLVHRIVRFLATQDYVGGLFVNDRLGSGARRAAHERRRPDREARRCRSRRSSSTSRAFRSIRKTRT